MLKIRIEGVPEELAEADKVLPVIFKILNESEAYPNRGNSVYHRKYIDVEVRKSDNVRKCAEKLNEI